MLRISRKIHKTVRGSIRGAGSACDGRLGGIEQGIRTQVLDFGFEMPVAWAARPVV